MPDHVVMADPGATSSASSGPERKSSWSSPGRSDRSRTVVTAVSSRSGSMTISVASRRSRCRDAQERAGDSEGSIFPYRKGYAAWKRSCLPAVQEQHGDSDVGQLETPRVEVGAVVIPPSLAAWRESVMNGIGHPGGHPALALQDGRIDRRQDRFEHLGQIAGRRSQAFLRALSIVART